MQQIAGTFGNSNRDEYLWTRKVTHNNGTLTIDLFDGSSQSLPVPATPSKITLPAIPEDFKRNVSKSRPGGGAANSRIAAELVGQELGETSEIRFLDANKRESLIESETPSPARFLDLRACPRNYVLGSRDRWGYGISRKSRGSGKPRQFSSMVRKMWNRSRPSSGSAVVEVSNSFWC
jgi:hypothetical protein